MAEDNHDRVSEKNPALVLFVVDVSESMRNSNTIEHVLAAVKPIQTIAQSKPGQIRFAVIGFDTNARLILNEPLEEAALDSLKVPSSPDSRTNLKLAAELAKDVYHQHVQDFCDDESPLASILFFTDGGHSYDVDLDWEIGIGSGNSTKNYWYNIHVDDYLDYPDNVICGVIDYNPVGSSAIALFRGNGRKSDFPEILPEGRNRMSKITRLTKELVDKAYAREKSHPTMPNQDLESIFGTRESLYGKLFSVGVGSIRRSPSTTSAFVRLGTYSATQSKSLGEKRPDISINIEDEL